MAARVKMVALAKLKPAEWNPREMKTKDFHNLCASIRDDPEFMHMRPVLAMADGTIYAGNYRYRACEYIGWSEVPAIMEDVPKELAEARAIRDNAHAGSWIDASLEQLIGGLAKQGQNIEALGFGNSETQRILASLTDGKAQKPTPEIAISPEVMERRDYLVFVFDNEIDWRAACDEFKIDTVISHGPERKTIGGGVPHKGVGRVIKASELLARIRKDAAE